MSDHITYQTGIFLREKGGAVTESAGIVSVICDPL